MAARATGRPSRHGSGAGGEGAGAERRLTLTCGSNECRGCMEGSHCDCVRQHAPTRATGRDQFDDRAHARATTQRPPLPSHRPDRRAQAPPHPFGGTLRPRLCLRLHLRPPLASSSAALRRLLRRAQLPPLLPNGGARNKIVRHLRRRDRGAAPTPAPSPMLSPTPPQSYRPLYEASLASARRIGARRRRRPCPQRSARRVRPSRRLRTARGSPAAAFGALHAATPSAYPSAVGYRGGPSPRPHVRSARA